MSGSPVMKGIYSSTQKNRIGAGMTSRASVTKRYWAVFVEANSTLAIQPLNQNLVPTGQKRAVTEEELAATFTFEPDYFVNTGGEAALQQLRSNGETAAAMSAIAEDDETTIPAPPAAKEQQPLPKRPATTWDFDDTPGNVRLDEELAGPPVGSSLPVDTGALEDADTEMAALLRRRREARAAERRLAEEETEQEARAGFGLALTHLKRGERSKALQLFEKIATMDGEFAPRHKHMFNEFGIGLRKSNLPEIALKMYRRTLELSPNDDHIYHNMARIHYERGETAKAVEMLEKSLELNPALDVSHKFLEYIEKKRKKFPRFSI